MGAATGYYTVFRTAWWKEWTGRSMGQPDWWWEVTARCTGQHRKVAPKAWGRCSRSTRTAAATRSCTISWAARMLHIQVGHWLLGLMEHCMGRRNTEA